MEKESIEFKAPSGMEMPEGIEVGGTFEAMATLKLGEEGELYLLAIDGTPIAGGEEDMEEEDAAETEPADMEQEGGFLDAVERRANES